MDTKDIIELLESKPSLVSLIIYYSITNQYISLRNLFEQQTDYNSFSGMVKYINKLKTIGFIIGDNVSDTCIKLDKIIKKERGIW